MVQTLVNGKSRALQFHLYHRIDSKFWVQNEWTF